jgi:hypothetical protein
LGIVEAHGTGGHHRNRHSSGGRWEIIDNINSNIISTAGIKANHMTSSWTVMRKNSPKRLENFTATGN